jgi:gas vesicle protein
MDEMGYMRGFVHGAMAGTVLGLCLAPQPGDQTRAQLSAFGRAARDGYGVARRTWEQIAPVVSGATSLVGHQVERMRRREEASSVDDGHTGGG